MHETVNVLIVEDSKTERFWEEKVLRGLGCEVNTAEDGLEALKYLMQHGEADMVLLDWNMPRMNGADFMRELRKNADLDHLKVLVVTGMDEREAMTCLEAGADEYWIKGASTLALKNRVTNLIKLISLERKLTKIKAILD